MIAPAKSKRQRLRFRAPSAGLMAKLGTVAIATALAVLPMPRGLIERWYSNGVYPLIQAAFTPLSNRVSFALVDVWLILLAFSLPAWWLITLIRARRGSRKRAVGSLMLHTTVIIALIALVFQLLWGFNYSRQPLAAKLEYDEHRLTAEAARNLRRLCIDRLNAESEAVHSNPWPPDGDLRENLKASLNRALSQIGAGRVVASVPKTSIFNFYLAAAGIEGFTNPFGHEVILDREILPFERPFLVAHEWSHLAGFADESEASFLGLISCLQSDSAAVRYSGLLGLYQLMPAVKNEQETGEPLPKLKTEVIADLKAAAERIRRHARPDLVRAQWKVYDQFLKANRVDAGVASYGLAFRLLLGTRFDPEWVPVRRNGS